jgi:hypothetical protein
LCRTHAGAGQKRAKQIPCAAREKFDESSVNFSAASTRVEAFPTMTPIEERPRAGAPAADRLFPHVLFRRNVNLRKRWTAERANGPMPGWRELTTSIDR